MRAANTQQNVENSGTCLVIGTATHTPARRAATACFSVFGASALARWKLFQASKAPSPWESAEHSPPSSFARTVSW